MSSPIKLNADEREALRGLPYLARVVYVELRALMDYQSGTAGSRLRIAWSTVRAACFVKPIPGLSGGGLPSEPKIKRAVAHLIKAGSLVKRSEGNRLIFDFPLADKGGEYPAQNLTLKAKQADPNPAQGRHIQADPQAEPFKTTQTGTPENPSKAFEDLGLLASRGDQADTANAPQAGPKVDRGEDGREATQADSNLVSVLSDSSSSSSASIPRAHVDVAPWLAALSRLSSDLPRFVFNESRLHRGRLLPLVGQWIDSGLTLDDLSSVARAVHDSRTHLRSFGPEYLQGPIADHLAAIRGHRGQATAAKVQQGGGGVNPSRSTYTSPAESREADRAAWEALLQRGVDLGLDQQPGENQVEFVERIRAEDTKLRRNDSAPRTRALIPVGDMLRAALGKQPTSNNDAGPS